MVYNAKIKRTSDGVEFVPFDLSCVIPYESKEFFDCFEGDKLIRPKFFGFLKRMYPKENWDGFVDLEWELEEDAGPYKYYHEKNLGLVPFHPILVDIKFYQGIGKIEKRPLKTGGDKPVRSRCTLLYYAHKEPMMRNLPSGICLTSSVSIGLKESHKRLLNLILSKRYKDWDFSKVYSLYSFPYYHPYFRIDANLKEWRVVPGLPSKVDEFLKAAEQLYDEEKFMKVDRVKSDIRALKEATETIKRIGGDIKDLEKEERLLLQELNAI